MKKIIVAVFIALLMLCFTASAFANEGEAKDSFMNSEIVDILMGQLNVAEKNLMNNEENYNDNMAGLKVKGEPVVVLYGNVLSWEKCDTALNVLLSKRQREDYNEYCVLTEDGYIALAVDMLADENNQFVGMGLYLTYIGGQYQPFLNDIKNATPEMTILGEECVVLNIYAFKIKTYDIPDVAVYYATDKGNFIRYYDELVNKDVWIKESDFAEYREEYWEYRLEKDAIKDETGDYAYGRISFTSFLEDNYGIGLEEKDSQSATPDENENIPLIIAYSVVIAVAITEIAVAVVLRKKSKTDRKIGKTGEGGVS